MEQGREREVRVAGRVGAPDLGPRRLLGARLVERDPDQRGAVALRPGDVDRRLVAGDEPLVGVHPLGQHGRQLAGVHEQAGDERLRGVGEVVRVLAVEELVATAGEERHVRVHARAVLAEQRLRHERRVVAVPGGDLLDDDAVRHRLVGHRERVVVAHVDLVLRRGDLVVVVLDLDADRLERRDRVVAHLGRRILHGHREVATLVDRLGALVVLEEEVLELRADVERVEAHLLHALEGELEDVARVALVRRAVGLDDVADHAADLGAELVAVVVDGPRHQLERRRIRDRDHVRLLDPVEAGDRRAVEAHPVVERALHLVGRDRERLEVPLEIREPEEDVLDALVLDPLQHRASRGDARRGPILALHLRCAPRCRRRAAPWSRHLHTPSLAGRTAESAQGRVPREESMLSQRGFGAFDGGLTPGRRRRYN